MKLRGKAILISLALLIGVMMPHAVSAFHVDTCCELEVGEGVCDSKTNPEVCMCTPGGILPGFRCQEDDCQEGECMYGGIKTYCCFQVRIIE